MPHEERDRCHRHPDREAVRTCDECGLPVCLDCAVPVRGRVLGAECLGIDLSRPATPRERRVLAPLAGLGFAIAVFATVLPWRRYGLGSGPFGAWGAAVRWSVISAVAAVAGLAVWAWPVVRRRKARSRTWRSAMQVLAAITVAAAVMHLLRPPMVGPLSYGAWVAIAGGGVALVGAVLSVPRGD